MKYNTFIKNSFLAAAVAFAAASCSEEVNYGNVQAPDVDDAELLYVTDADGNAAPTASIDFRDNMKVPMFVNSTKPASKAHSIQFTYDAAALDEFNASRATAIEALPAEFVSFENGGLASLAAGATQSEAINMVIASDGTLDHETTYAIPVRVTTTTGTMASTSSVRIYVVHDLSALPDCHKTVLDEEGNEVEGVKIFSCMEVNDTNPLNNLRYTLKNSGKYMVDALIIFSGNINYDSEKGTVWFNANENVQALLDNKDKYLKPLKDRGMKIIMGILCNHDRACISNLAEETAKKFAQDLKALADAYDLDGFFWDDEYCSPIYPAPPGFVTPSSAAWNRLAYEVWKIQPERWNVAYAYSRTAYGQEIDGVQPGVFITYALHDYGGSYDLSSNYPGMPKSNMGLYSQEFAQGRFASENNLRNMRKNGYGAHMVFAMDPNRSNQWRQDNAMGNCARAFYDDEVVINEPIYAKDW